MTLRNAVHAELRRFLLRLEPFPAGIFVLAGLLLWVYDYYGGTDFYERVLSPRVDLAARDQEAAAYFYWFGTAFVLLFLLPLAASRALARLARVPPAPTGLGLGEWRVGLPAAAVCYGVMVPILFSVVWSGDFLGKYPLLSDAARDPRLFVAYELAYAGYFVAWEFFFRGFMTFGLERTLGVWTVFVQTLPFAVMHFGKPDLEAMSSVVGGIALGWLALRTRSIWYGVLLHAGVAVTLDLMVVAIERRI